ncbi:MAG TPA: hypothetical protein DGC56_05040 [Alistipes putredinis]|uniref:Uncharacterized protein n=1 Tax=Alistipes finegoldii TaxID=214856 RepID=A0ABQ6S0D7_9BACT|nr:hypothetical protein F2A26_13965 [Alistipes finegoldii]RYU16572.1 hypothetical protein EAI98_13875 [Alistipes finegoldii]DAV27268.1 MAG TPA: hypothetical protein [Caudoviricetes sp.]HBW11733.1 hypothetical protein [Alistipes sp.]HCV84361.1 hypothetical protein [Alistipes putredinis]
MFSRAESDGGCENDGQGNGRKFYERPESRIPESLRQISLQVTAAVLEPCSSTVPLHTKTNPAAKVETTRGLYSVYRASSGRYINGRGGGPSRPQGEL